MLRIEVFSDVVCPWCFVGKRRLEEALAIARRRPSEAPAVEVVWRAFELNPGLPREGVDRAAYRRAKFGSPERSQLLDARLVAAGESVGIAFAFDKIRRTPNTFDAHRLLWLAGALGRQDAVAEALFRAYFLDGRDVGDHAVLADLADGAGVPRARAESLLRGREGDAEVRADEERAWTSGIQGVPHFVIGAAGVSGAQPAEVIAAAIEAALRSGAEV